MDKTIALYMRLSDEDDNLAAHEESNSISHQRKLMLDHIQKLPELKDCNIMEFSDDGYSGADFSRPNFVKMMDLVKAGKIQVIVTKDYSRLGRDYLEVGNYMECIFPVLQVRYISVNDNYDSANSFGSTGGMSVALKNLVNALYCKDASKKVRAAKAVLAKQGKYIAAFAPFGYQKSEDDKHMLVPDPVTAPVVQLIFELAIKGMKYTEIANYLNNNGYDSIFEYYQKIGVKRCYERDIGEHMWSASTVMEILYNEVYIGSVINNKTADNIDTGHQVVQRDKEDWIIVENCHGIYEIAIAHSKDNPFKKYLEFLKELDELNQDEEVFYKGIGREFISLLENTSMSKVYKMPVLMAFYNHGNILMEVSEEQLLSSWKEFFSTGTNWKDLDKNMTIQKYNSISDKEHLKKILSMPVHFLLESGKGFFVKKDGAAIGLREELRPLIDNPVMVCQMKDVIDYRAMDYYQRRYRQSQEDGEL